MTLLKVEAEGLTGSCLAYWLLRGSEREIKEEMGCAEKQWL